LQTKYAILVRWLGSAAMKKQTKKYKSVLKDIEKRFENKDFELVLSSLTIEEIITAKLELSARGLNGKLFGFPIFKNINQITKESLVRFALRFCNSQKQAAALLGLSVAEFKSYIRKYNLNTIIE